MRRHFDKVTVGEKPTLLEAEQANKVYKSLNQLANITIDDADTTSIEYTDEGIKITVKQPEIQDTVTTIGAAFPLKVIRNDTKAGIHFDIILEGYTQFIKYCGGEGNLLFLNEPYNSSQYLPKSTQGPTTINAQ